MTRFRAVVSVKLQDVNDNSPDIKILFSSASDSGKKISYNIMM